jgi:tight adherence protein C
MTLLLLIGLALLGVSVSLLARALFGVNGGTGEAATRIEAYGFGGRAVGPATEQPRLLDRLADRLGAALAARMSSFREAPLRRLLMSAGMYGTSPRKLLGYRVLATVLTPIVTAWFASTAALSGAQTFLLVIVAAALGWFGPVYYVKKRAQRRLDQLDYELPELIDLLVVTVEAGLGFTGSMQIAADRLRGPLGQELRLAMQEQRMGLSATEALHNFMERCDTPGVRMFVRSVIQGERLGVSIGQIMRNLAIEMRKRRRQAAEERAHKAPTKLLFPLVLLIFPAMFVVLLAPAGLTLIETFKK